jgi:hypothetical protein
VEITSAALRSASRRSGLNIRSSSGGNTEQPVNLSLMAGHSSKFHRALPSNKSLMDSNRLPTPAQLVANRRSSNLHHSSQQKPTLQVSSRRRYRICWRHFPVCSKKVQAVLASSQTARTRDLPMWTPRPTNVKSYSQFCRVAVLSK